MNLSRVAFPVRVGVNQARTGAPVTLSSPLFDELKESACCYMSQNGAAKAAAVGDDRLPEGSAPHILASSDAVLAPPPTLRHAPHTSPNMQLTLQFEMLSIHAIPPASNAAAQAELHATVVERLRDSLGSLQRWMQTNEELPTAAAMCHFRPPSQGVPVTVMCPLDAEKCSLEAEAAPAMQAWRRNLHHNTLTAADRPTFRTALRLTRGAAPGMSANMCVGGLRREPHLSSRD